MTRADFPTGASGRSRSRATILYPPGTWPERAGRCGRAAALMVRRAAHTPARPARTLIKYLSTILMNSDPILTRSGAWTCRRARGGRRECSQRTARCRLSETPLPHRSRIGSSTNWMDYTADASGAPRFDGGRVASHRPAERRCTVRAAHTRRVPSAARASSSLLLRRSSLV